MVMMAESAGSVERQVDTIGKGAQHITFRVRERLSPKNDTKTLGIHVFKNCVIYVPLSDLRTVAEKP